jgi:hypothetical protein
MNNWTSVEAVNQLSNEDEQHLTPITYTPAVDRIYTIGIILTEHVQRSYMVREIEYVGRQHTVECFPFVNVYNPTRKTTFNSSRGI